MQLLELLLKKILASEPLEISLFCEELPRIVKSLYSLQFLTF